MWCLLCHPGVKDVWSLLLLWRLERVRIVCSLDTLLFGPFYSLSLYAFATGAQEARWYELTALPVSGALFYSTVMYFAYEVLAESHRADDRRRRRARPARTGWTVALELTERGAGTSRRNPVPEKSSAWVRNSLWRHLQQTETF